MAAATRGNVRFFLIDPSGLTTEFGTAERDMNFRAVAEMTGGFAQVGSNTFGAAFERVVSQTSVYYVLGCESSEPKREGRYVRIDVKTKRPGLMVKARSGYLEHMEYIRLRMPREPERLRVGGVRVVSEFELPKGRYQVRVAAVNASRNGSVVYDLDVPDFSDGPLSMSGVAVSTMSPDDTVTLRPGANRRSDKKARQCRTGVCEPSVVLESTLERWRPAGAPTDASLRRDVLPALPVTQREFAPNETLSMFLEVYDNNRRAQRDPPYPIEVSAGLHGASGEVVRAVSEQRSSRAGRRPSGGHGFTLRLPLDRPPAGAYTLRLEARSTSNPEFVVVSRNIPIRVRPSAPSSNGDGDGHGQRLVVRSQNPVVVHDFADGHDKQ